MRCRCEARAHGAHRGKERKQGPWEDVKCRCEASAHGAHRRGGGKEKRNRERGRGGGWERGTQVKPSTQEGAPGLPTRAAQT